MALLSMTVRLEDSSNGHSPSGCLWRQEYTPYHKKLIFLVGDKKFLDVDSI